MKKLKKSFILFYPAVLLLCLAFSFAAGAESSYFSGDFRYRILNNGTAEITEYTGANSEVEIPEAIDLLNVSALGAHCFSGNETLEKVSFPRSLVSIGSFCFAGCRNLAEAVIPDNVSFLGKNAFENCSSLEKISLSASLKTIGEGTFKNCLMLDGVTVPEGVASVEKSAFEGCLVLGKITFPKTLRRIENRAFFGCSRLGAIVLPDALEELGDLAFAETECAYVSCPPALKRVGYNPFFGAPLSYNQNLNGIYWGGWLIGYEDFPNGTDGEDIFIRKGTTGIAAHVFSPENEICSPYYLRSVMIPDTVKYIGESAFEKSRFSELRLPDSVLEIGDGAFQSCDYLKKITLSKNLRRIGSMAFANCGILTSVSIPDSVQSIGSNAFYRTFAVDSQKTAVKYIDGWVVAAPALQGRLTLKKDVRGICEDAFLSFEKELTVFKGAKHISSHAFGYCKSGGNYLKLKNFTLVCEKNSAAHKFALKNGLKFRIICLHENLSGWITDKKATASSAGSRHKSCLDCKKVIRTEKIPIKKCAAPVLSRAVKTKSGVKVTWKKTAGAKSFVVLRKTGKGKWKSIGTTTKTSFVDRKAKKGVKYTYTVRAKNAAGLSPYSKKGVSCKL